MKDWSTSTTKRGTITRTVHITGLTTALLALSLVTGGCLNVGHIQTLRASQDDFSALAERENELLEAGGPPALTTNDLKDVDVTQLSPTVRAAEAEALLRGYRDVHMRTEALKERAESELRDDDLYGTAAALAVLAYWRATFYAQLVGAEAEGAGDPPALSDVRARADAAEREMGDEPLFQRDRFLLQALPALLRYDIAYLRALREAREGRLPDASDDAAVHDRVHVLVAQMATAEQELAATTACAPQPDGSLACRNRNALGYAVLARYRMLDSAYVLAARVRISPPDVGAAASDHPLHLLRERSCALRAEMARPPVRGIAGRAGLDPVGLGEGAFDCS